MMSAFQAAAQKLYFEDLKPGYSTDKAGPYLITEAEILEFGERFDPQPFHTDKIAAETSVFGGLTAPGCLVFAARSWLVNHLPQVPAYMAGLGLENMDLPQAVRPGDELYLQLQCLELRPSNSRPNAGIVKFLNTMTNQRGDTVLTMIAKVMVARRGGDSNNEEA